jgi:class 3 adenylate cyclase
MRLELPTGTVTFLFTDVEGSTKLLAELGPERYATALAEHRQVVRIACARHGGAEVDTQGDAFFLAFPTAASALAAAAETTDALGHSPLSLRMGLHTGTPLVTAEGYVGVDVHRAARIAAVAHGGQVLLSTSTANLVDVELTDLGEHRLKDLMAPERLYQLGASEFPPLRSLYQTNLPVPTTPFLGRKRELNEIIELLARKDLRLLTFVGPGGAGKTRLAVQAAG